MAQNVENLRGFFSAFFALSQPVWAGFLAGYPGLPNNHRHDTWTGRLSFALDLFFKLPLQVQLNIMFFAVKLSLEFGPNLLLRSVTPPFVFGSGPNEPTWSPPPATVGEEGTKLEARRMMKEFLIRKDEEEENGGEAVTSILEQESIGKGSRNAVTASASAPYYYNPVKGLLPPPFDQ